MGNLTEQLNMHALAALAKANEVRSLRAKDKNLIKLGRLDPVTVLLRPDPWWENARTVELLLSVDRVGRRKASVWLNRHDVAPTRRLGSLTPRQRAGLADAIESEQARQRKALDDRVL